MNSMEEESTTKQESSTSTYSTKASSSSSTSWSKLKDPRIVRVSRSFGGKDRHSKVYTVRGLRDRRIRLSVPTAIQLYDLQERLGLNQPSKVVDWLLNVAKNEIDTLPPLQFPQGSLFGSHDPLNHESRSDNFWEKSKEFSGEITREENWEERQFINNFQENDQNANNLLSGQNPSSLMNGIFPYHSFVRRELSDLSLSHPPQGSHGLTEDLRNFSLVPLPSTLSGSHMHQHGMSAQSYFHPQINGAMDQDLDHKQLHFQSSSNSLFTSSVVSSTTQPIRPFPFSLTANLLPNSQNNSGRQ